VIIGCLASEEDLADLETDVLAGFVLARASAGLADSTIRNDTGHLELNRDWFGRPLREMQPDDADAYFGKVLRDAKPSTRTGRAAASRSVTNARSDLAHSRRSVFQRLRLTDGFAAQITALFWCGVRC
jgi:hypothetical protein